MNISVVHHPHYQQSLLLNSHQFSSHLFHKTSEACLGHICTSLYRCNIRCLGKSEKESDACEGKNWVERDSKHSPNSSLRKWDACLGTNIFQNDIMPQCLYIYLQYTQYDFLSSTFRLSWPSFEWSYLESNSTKKY